MTNFDRVPSGPLASPTSPSTIAASATVSAGLTIATASASGTNAVGSVSCVVTIGATAPGTSPTVQPWFTYDGTNQIAVNGPYVVPITSVSTSYSYTLDSSIPVGAVTAGFTIVNGTGQSITAFIQGGVLSLP